MDNIKVLIKEPWKKAVMKEIPNTLEALQKIVGGFIELVTISTDVSAVVNEEGLINGLKYNVSIGGHALFGTVILLGIDGEDFCSLQYSLNTIKIVLPALFVGE